MLYCWIMKQLQDVDIYEDIDLKESDLFKLLEKSNTMFQSLRRKNLITEKELKVSEYPFKQNKNVLKNMTVILCTNFCNISFNVPRPTFFNMYNLPFLHSPNIGKIRVKVGPKTDYFSYILGSCTNRIAVFNGFFSLICSQPRDKLNRTRDFLLSKYFLNNLLSCKIRFQSLVSYYNKKFNNSLLGKMQAQFCAVVC